MPAQDVRCPTCNAAPGEPCWSRDRGKEVAVHSRRKKYARLQHK